MKTALLGSTTLAPITSFQRPFGPRVLHDETAASALPVPASVNVTHSAPASTSDAIGAREAAQILQAERKKKRDAAVAAPAASVAEEPINDEHADVGADQVTAADELSDEGSAAPGENQATGETDGTENPAAETPKPLPLPRSWTKEQADVWNGLPRSTQEYLTEQATKASAELRRIQNEAAENSKTLTVKEKAAEEQRNQYEGKLKSVVEIMEREQLRDFPEIRSQGDLDKMVNEAVQLSAQAEGLWSTDPLRAGQVQSKVQQIQSKLAAWDVHQRKLVAATNELKAADDRKSKEKVTSWDNHVKAENKLAADKIPELADKVKGPALRAAAIEALTELGFSQDDMAKLATGEERISIADHRLQVLIRSHLRLAEIQKAPKAVAAKTLPPVQQPGAAAPRGTAQSETIKSLTTKLNNSGSLADAVALRKAQQRAQRRA